MATVRDLIRLSCVNLGVTTPSPSDYEDALALLVRMLDAWNARALCLGTSQRVTATWTANQSQRTIGATGQITSIARPLWIDRWSLIPVGQTSEAFAAKRVLTRREYAEIVDKASTATYFSELAYEPTFPNGTVIVWPVPTTAPTLVLYVPTPITAAVTLDTTLSYAPAFEETAQYQLTRRLAPIFGQPWTETLRDLAADAHRTWTAANLRVEPRRNDPTLVGSGGTFDIDRGAFR